MPTPRREEILEMAKELFLKENPNAPTPENHELVESGYYHKARDQLMQNEENRFHDYLEEQATQNGYRIVTEREHSKLVDLERTKNQLRTEKNRARRLEEELEEARSEKQNTD